MPSADAWGKWGPSATQYWGSTLVVQAETMIGQ